MNSPSDKNRERMDSDIIQSDLKALRESTKKDLPTADKTAQALWEHNLRVSQEGTFMKFLHSLKQRPALATALGVLIVAAVLLGHVARELVPAHADRELEPVDPADVDEIHRVFSRRCGPGSVLHFAGRDPTVRPRGPDRGVLAAERRRVLG